MYAGQIAVGLILIAIGIIANVAREHTRVKAWIEKYILGGEEFSDEHADYGPIFRSLGFPSIVSGLLVLIPGPIMWDLLIVAALVLVVLIGRHLVLKRTSDKKGVVAES